MSETFNSFDCSSSLGCSKEGWEEESEEDDDEIEEEEVREVGGDMLFDGRDGSR